MTLLKIINLDGNEIGYESKEDQTIKDLRDYLILETKIDSIDIIYNGEFLQDNTPLTNYKDKKLLCVPKETNMTN